MIFYRSALLRLLTGFTGIIDVILLVRAVRTVSRTRARRSLSALVRARLLQVEFRTANVAALLGRVKRGDRRTSSYSSGLNAVRSFVITIGLALVVCLHHVCSQLVERRYVGFIYLALELFLRVDYPVWQFIQQFVHVDRLISNALLASWRRNTGSQVAQLIHESFSGLSA